MESARVPTELSPHNPRIAQAHELLSPAGRRAQRRFGAEGFTLLAEAERSAVSPLEVYLSDALKDPSGLVGRYEAAGIPVYRIPARAFARITDAARCDVDFEGRRQYPGQRGEILAQRWASDGQSRRAGWRLPYQRQRSGHRHQP